MIQVLVFISFRFELCDVCIWIGLLFIVGKRGFLFYNYGVVYKVEQKKTGFGGLGLEGTWEDFRVFREIWLVFGVCKDLTWISENENFGRGLEAR